MRKLIIALGIVAGLAGCASSGMSDSSVPASNRGPNGEYMGTNSQSSQQGNTSNTESGGTGMGTGAGVGGGAGTGTTP